MSKRATREALGDEVLSLGGECDKIYVIDCDVSKSCKTQSFAAAFPDRHVNAGISEQNAVGMAAGLETTGKTKSLLIQSKVWNRLESTTFL